MAIMFEIDRLTNFMKGMGLLNERSLREKSYEFDDLYDFKIELSKSDISISSIDVYYVSNYKEVKSMYRGKPVANNVGIKRLKTNNFGSFIKSLSMVIKDNSMINLLSCSECDFEIEVMFDSEDAIMFMNKILKKPIKNIEDFDLENGIFSVAIDVDTDCCYDPCNLFGLNVTNDAIIDIANNSF